MMYRKQTPFPVELHHALHRVMVKTSGMSRTASITKITSLRVSEMANFRLVVPVILLISMNYPTGNSLEIHHLNFVMLVLLISMN